MRKLIPSDSVMKGQPEGWVKVNQLFVKHLSNMETHHQLRSSYSRKLRTASPKNRFQFHHEIDGWMTCNFYLLVNSISVMSG